MYFDKFHIKQFNENDCGVACITSLIKFHNINTSLNYNLDLLYKSTNYNLKDLKYILDKYNCFNVNFFEVNSGNIVEVIKEKKIQLPCIILAKNTKGNHYVVIYKVTKTKFIIGDPNYENVKKINYKELESLFSGVVLNVTLNKKNEVAKSKDLNINFLVKSIIKNYKLVFIIIFFVSILFVILNVFNSLYQKFLVDVVIPNNANEFLIQLSIFFLFTVIFSVLLNYLRSVLIIKVANNVDRDLSILYFEKLLKLPVNFFEKREDGEILSRFEDANHIRSIVSITIVAGILDFLIVVGLGAFIYLSNQIMFLALIALISCLSIILTLYYGKIEKVNRDRMEKQADTYSYIVEHLKYMPSIYALNKSDAFYNGFSTSYRRQLKSMYTESMTGNNYVFLKNLITGSFSIVFLGLGAQQVLVESITLGDLFFLGAVLAFVVNSIENLSDIQIQIQRGIVAAKRYLDILNYPVFNEGNEKLKKKVRGINVKNLHFEFSPYKKVFSNFTINISENEFVIIEGKSGTGKSTLAKIIAKLYPVDNGTIEINDKEINSINASNYRQEVVYLHEEPYIFKGTLNENLFIDDTYNNDAVFNALRAAKVDEDLIYSPLGLETMITENGNNLSSGQKQRIALARALILNPSVLILDEALGNLDEQNFRAIIKNLKSLDITIIIITHSSYLIEGYDQKIKL